MKFLARYIAVTLILLFVWQNVPAEPVASGGPAKYRWKSDKVRIAVSRSVLSLGSDSDTDSGTLEAIRRGVDAWQGIADVELVTELTDRENASILGATGDGISLITIAPTAENILLFGKNDLDAAAKTRVFYNRRDFITEADIVLNPYQQFSTDGRYGTFDLESVITHEIGHLLGLRHNDVFGSIMYRTTAKNGTFGLAEISSRQISATDKSALRDLYGYSGSAVCCGTIVGKLIGTAKSGRVFDLWVESVDTGGVAGHVSIRRDGTFRVGGLGVGEYRVFARDTDKAGSSTIFPVGEVGVLAGESHQLNKKIGKVTRGVAFKLLGINGLMGESSLQLTPGQNYTIYVGGSGFDAGSVELFTNSAFITIESGSIRELDYVDGVSAVSFQLNIAQDTPSGSYSIFGTSANGANDAIVGGIVITYDRKK